MIIDNIPYHSDNIRIKKYDSIRIKTTNTCQFSCNFCHSEGSKKTQDLIINSDFIDCINLLKEKLNLDSVHLTGGEPTVYKNLEELLKLLNDNSFTIKITTNGQHNNNTLPLLKDNNIESINFSIHTLNPIKLGLLQKPPRDFKWGIKALSNQLEYMIRAKKMGFRVKLNTVIQEEATIDDIINFCKAEQIELRLLDDLNFGSISSKAILNMLVSRNAIVKGLNFIEHISTYSSDVKTQDGFEFKIKSIKKNILPSICNNCEVRDNCTEWFYGIRVENISDKLMIRLCLHKDDPDVLQPYLAFFESKQFEEIKVFQSQKINL